MNSPIKTPEELVKWAEKESNRQLEKMSKVDEDLLNEAFKIRDEDPDAYRDNEEDR